MHDRQTDCTLTAGNIGGTGEYLMNKLDIPLEAQKSINFGRLVSGQDMDTNEVKQVHAVDLGMCLQLYSYSWTINMPTNVVDLKADNKQ